MNRQLPSQKVLRPAKFAHFVLRTRNLEASIAWYRKLELQVENFDSSEAALSFLHSKAFEENPIGVEFDPEKLAARFEQGDPLEDLVARAPLDLPVGDSAL